MQVIHSINLNFLQHLLMFNVVEHSLKLLFLFECSLFENHEQIYIPPRTH